MDNKEILEKVLQEMGIPSVPCDKPSPIYIDGVPAPKWFETHSIEKLFKGEYDNEDK